VHCFAAHTLVSETITLEHPTLERASTERSSTASASTERAGMERSSAEPYSAPAQKTRARNASIQARDAEGASPNVLQAQTGTEISIFVLRGCFLHMLRACKTSTGQHTLPAHCSRCTAATQRPWPQLFLTPCSSSGSGSVFVSSCLCRSFLLGRFLLAFFHRRRAEAICKKRLSTKMNLFAFGVYRKTRECSTIRTRTKKSQRFTAKKRTLVSIVGETLFRETLCPGSDVQRPRQRCSAIATRSTGRRKSGPPAPTATSTTPSMLRGGLAFCSGQKLSSTKRSKPDRRGCTCLWTHGRSSSGRITGARASAFPSLRAGAGRPASPRMQSRRCRKEMSKSNARVILLSGVK
jgi:hypothetical protein